MKPRVFTSAAFPDEILAGLRDSAELVVWQGADIPTADEITASLSGCAGLLCLLTNPIDAALIESCPDLRWVSSMSVGVDHVDVVALTSRGIPLGHTPGVLVDTTADLAFALLLAAARRVAEGDRFVRSGSWSPETPWAPDFFVGKDVSGATLGILGLGDIGQAVARRAQGFNMRTLGWARSGRQVSGVETVSFETVLEQADFVSVHVALNEETRNLIDASTIARMKPGAVLVNTARGGVVDERALAQALITGHLSAAGLDVFEQEPLAANSPLLGLENVVMVPHIGSASAATRRKMAELAVANLCAAIEGRSMPHCFNPEVYSPMGK